MLKLLSSHAIRLIAAAAPLALATVAHAEEPLFDAAALKMMRASAELNGERYVAPQRRTVEPKREHEESSAPAPVLRHLPDPTPTPSLAHPVVALRDDEQKHFGPQSSGRKYDPRMIEAARIARQRAEPRMTYYCWRYVKDALVEAGVVDSRPESAYAKEAGRELTSRYGFVKLRLNDPREAPVGAVVVYGGNDAGHVELRTEHGFVSDFVSRSPYPRPLLGIYVKPS